MSYRKTLLPTMERNEYAEALGALTFGVDDKKLVIVMGPAGVGKTELLHDYLLVNPEASYVFCSPNMTMKGMLVEIGSAIGISVRGDAYTCQKQIVQALKVDPKHCILLDECEHLHHGNIRKLDTIRQIYDETGVPFVLCGTYLLKEVIVGIGAYREQPQLLRRLLRAEFMGIAQHEVFVYLDNLETLFAISFSKEAKDELFLYCNDRDNGGLGNFVEQLELILTILRPEWKQIMRQHTPSDAGDLSGDESALALAQVDVSALPTIKINKAAIRDAIRFKLTK